MKNAPLYRRILSVVLTVAMLFSLLVPAVSAENGKAASQVEELELVPVDPGTLESLKVKFISEDTTVNQEDHKLTDVVRVSIVLDKASTLEAGFQAEGIAKNAAAKSYREGLRAEQAAMTAKIVAGRYRDIRRGRHVTSYRAGGIVGDDIVDTIRIVHSHGPRIRRPNASETIL